MKVSKTRRIFSIILFIILLPIIGLYYVILGIYKLIKKSNWEKNGKKGKELVLTSDITRIDLMEGYQFEEFVSALFFYGGYDVKNTQRSRDYGADVILKNQEEDTRIAVQVKRYSKRVGAKSVQEIGGAREHYKTDEAWVVTNNYFTSQAETLARDMGVRLIDRDELIEILRQVKERLNGDSNDYSDNQFGTEIQPDANDFSI